jgi:hypothetical protein
MNARLLLARRECEALLQASGCECMLMIQSLFPLGAPALVDDDALQIVLDAVPRMEIDEPEHVWMTMFANARMNDGLFKTFWASIIGKPSGGRLTPRACS